MPQCARRAGHFHCYFQDYAIHLYSQSTGDSCGCRSINQLNMNREVLVVRVIESLQDPLK